MNKKIQLIIVITLSALLISTQSVKAEALTAFNQKFDFDAIGAADEVQNNLDEGARTNVDTWDPVPSGVWFGGWPIESLIRLNDVPDTDFEIALSTVCRFGSDIIMSGAARTLVRLPIYTSNDPWTRARLNVYEISADSNWTFTYFNTTIGTFGYQYGHMRINFTAGNHELIFYSEDYSPTDVSPTDGDDHFTRGNRSFAFVDAPIAPNKFYLFVTYVFFASDKYVDFYLQSDSLDSEGKWNKSSLGIFNEIAPDTYDLDVHNFNTSFGYSFDFRNGYGNSGYGLNIWMNSQDELKFYSYIDPKTITDTDYLSLMIPYRSTVDNISWDIWLYEYTPADSSFTEFFVKLNYTCRDFILISMYDDWDTCSTAQSLDGTGWYFVTIRPDNNTRIWLPLWDIPESSGGQMPNKSWQGVPAGNIWDSESPCNYNLMRYIKHEQSVTKYYIYHWMLQHSIQYNNYQWQRSIPQTTGTEQIDTTENMTLTQKLIFGIGSIIIKIGTFTQGINYGAGTAIRAAGCALQLIAVYADLPDFFGYVWDKIQQIKDFFAGIGQWLWRAAQEIKGFLEIFIDLASFVLGILILLLSIIVAIVPIVATFHIAGLCRRLLLGDIEGAKREAGAAIDVVQKITKRG